MHITPETPARALGLHSQYAIKIVARCETRAGAADPSGPLSSCRTRCCLEGVAGLYRQERRPEAINAYQHLWERNGVVFKKIKPYSKWKLLIIHTSK